MYIHVYINTNRIYQLIIIPIHKILNIINSNFIWIGNPKYHLCLFNIYLYIIRCVYIYINNIYVGIPYWLFPIGYSLLAL